MVVRKIKYAYEVDIDKNKCIGCLLCVQSCPVDVLESRLKSPFPSPYPAHEEDCVGCRNCQEVCPTNAIKIRPTEPEESIRGTWTFDTIDDINERARTGKSPVIGGGSNRRLPNFDDLLVIPAQILCSPVDKYRETCDTRVTIGDNELVESPLELNLPMVVGAMSYGALSREAKIAIAKATNMVGIATNTGEGGMLPEEREYAKRLIVQYSTGRFGVSEDYLRASDAVEIKIGQGAKPGMGGHLLAEKVTADIAKVRRIPEGTDALSPARHLDIQDPRDLSNHIELIRDVTDYRVPVIVKLAIGRVREEVKIVAEAGADAISLDGMQGGTGAAPEMAMQHAGLPTIAAISQADGALREIGLRNKINLLVSGGIRNGADIVKALALGADAVQLSRGILIAMGCKVCGQCAKGECCWGISTQKPEYRKNLDIEKSAEKVANYITSLGDDINTLVMLSGKNNIHDLNIDDLRSININSSAITGVKLIGA
jgi:glutamate synthase domain-containing protein 2